MMEAVRPATAGDLERLGELAGLARKELSIGRGGDLFVRREGGRPPGALADALDDADHSVWVGTFSDALVGYGVAHVEPASPLDPGGELLGVVDDLYVEPDARGVGVGEVLIDALIDWMLGRGCRGIDATALPGNRETKNFYERAGFTARLLIMHRRFDG